MFDAYFAPPFIETSDAVHMARFGVTHCVLAIASAHCEGPSVRDQELGANHPYVSPQLRQRHAHAVLERAGIDVSIADVISPHLEPERSWEHQWQLLVQRVQRGEVHALGVIRFLELQDRGLDILDRHLVLSKAHDVPILVKMPTRIDPEDRRALMRRAAAHAERWYWVQPTLRFAHAALRRGEGAIVSIRPRVSAEDIVALSTMLSSLQRRRLCIGSSQGRGLNPFALASVEIALDRHAHTARAAREILQGGALALQSAPTQRAAHALRSVTGS